MTIPATTRKAGPYSGTGAQTTWPFTFRVFAAGDIAVTIANSAGVETLLTLGSDYTVAVNANQDTSPGGTVTYPVSGSALPVGSSLTIVGDIDYDQPYDIPSGGNFSPVALENQLDRTVMQVQQLLERSDRSVSLPLSAPISVSRALPLPQATQFLRWNATSDALENADIASGGSIGIPVPVAQGGTGVTSSTGTGSVVRSASPTLTTPNLGTPSAVVLTSATGLPLTTGVTGTLPIANGGTGATTASNAFTFLKQPATLTGTGVVELATNAEAAAGTDTSRAITPAALFGGLNASGSAPIYAARAWVNFDGTGTPGVRASGNVSSITDVGTGTYTVNFTTAMLDTNYAWALSGRSASATGFYTFSNGDLAAPTVSTFTFLTIAVANSSTTDQPFVTAAFFR